MLYQRLGDLDSNPIGNKYQYIIDALLPNLDESKHEVYYFLYGPTPYGPEINYNDIKAIQYQKSTVVWIVLDGFAESDEFDWYQESRPKTCVEFEKICQAHPQKRFFLLTELRRLVPLLKIDNLTIIELPSHQWIPGLEDYQHGYLTKSDLQFQWLCFVNSPRWHRVGLLSYLLSLNLEHTGGFTFSKPFFDRCQQFEHIYNFLTYKFSWPMYQMLDVGYQKIVNQSVEPLQLPTYIGYQNQNVSNYNNALLPVYNHTKVEIVSSTLFSEPYLLFSEKEMQAIYACNFVIFISTAGTVEHLRNLGFDVFDDVVNHSYDSVVEPHLRLIKAIDDNQHLLDGSTDLDSLWKPRYQRFVDNCFLADKIFKSSKSQSTIDAIIGHFQSQNGNH